MTHSPWRFKARADVVTGPVVHADTVFAGTADQQFHAVDSATGALRWRSELPAVPARSPVISGDAVCVATASGDICAFAADTGEPRWSVPAAGAAEGFAVDADGNVLVRGSRTELRSIDTATGRIRWRQQFSDSFAVPVTVSGADVLVHDGFTGRCHCLSVDTGKERWTTYYGSQFAAFRPAAVSDGGVFVGSGVGEVVAMSLSDGKIRWRDEATRTDLRAQEQPWDPVYGQSYMKFAPAVESTPLVVDDGVFVVLRNGFLYCRPVDGGYRWSDLTYPPMAPELTASAGLVMGLIKPGRIRAWNICTGEKKWTVRSGRGCTPPVAAGDFFYVACGRTIRAHTAVDGAGPSLLFGR